MEFSKLLIQRRKELGLSQEALAQEIQVSRQAISKWENGDSYPDLPKLIALSNVLNISLDQLCGRNQEVIQNNTIQKEMKKTNKKSWLIIPIILISFLLGTLVTKKEEIHIPDNIQVFDTKLDYYDGKLHIALNTNIVEEQFTYEIVLTSFNSNNETKKYELECNVGVCSAVFYSKPLKDTNVSLMISNENESKTTLFMKDLMINETVWHYLPVK